MNSSCHQIHHQRIDYTRAKHITLWLISLCILLSLSPFAESKKKEKDMSAEKNSQAANIQPTRAQQPNAKMLSDKILQKSFNEINHQTFRMNSDTLLHAELIPVQDNELIPARQLLVYSRSMARRQKGQIIIIPKEGLMPTETQWFTSFSETANRLGWDIFASNLPLFQVPQSIPSLQRKSPQTQGKSDEKTQEKKKNKKKSEKTAKEETKDSQQPEAQSLEASQNNKPEGLTKEAYLKLWEDSTSLLTQQLIQYAEDNKKNTGPQHKTIILAFERSAYVASLVASQSPSQLHGLVLINMKSVSIEKNTLLKEKLSEQKPILELIQPRQRLLKQASLERRAAAALKGNLQYMTLELPQGQIFNRLNGQWLAKKIHGWAFPRPRDRKNY